VPGATPVTVTVEDVCATVATERVPDVAVTVAEVPPVRVNGKAPVFIPTSNVWFAGVTVICGAAATVTTKVVFTEFGVK